VARGELFWPRPTPKALLAIDALAVPLWRFLGADLSGDRSHHVTYRPRAAGSELPCRTCPRENADPEAEMVTTVALYTVVVATEGNGRLPVTAHRESAAGNYFASCTPAAAFSLASRSINSCSRAASAEAFADNSISRSSIGRD
jgi:hypothetical protein